MVVKLCADCGEAERHPGQSYCRPCHRERDRINKRIQRETDPTIAARQTIYRRRHRERKKAERLKHVDLHELLRSNTWLAKQRKDQP